MLHARGHSARMRSVRTPCCGRRHRRHRKFDSRREAENQVSATSKVYYWFKQFLQASRPFCTWTVTLKPNSGGDHLSPSNAERDVVLRLATDAA